MNIKEKITKLEKDLVKIKKEIEPQFTKFTFRGKEYAISEDLGETDWYDAKAKCKELGGKLPPRWLLCAIHDEPELKEIKEMLSGNYWSSTEYFEADARYVYFTSGSSSNNYKTYTYYVRCVKGL